MHVLYATLIVFIIIVLLLRSYQKRANGKCISKKRLDGKTCVVTGGTAGMGLIIAQEFASRGAKVIIASPYPHEGIPAEHRIQTETGNKNVTFKLLDLTNFDSVRSFAADILKTEDRLDILVNNAGIGKVKDITSKDGMTLVMKVNYFGHVLLTLLLLPLLKRSGTDSEPSRIVNTASKMHYLTLTKPDVEVAHACGIRNYSFSKLYVIYFTRVLAKKLQGSNVVVNSVDPGLVGTGIYGTTCSAFIGVGFICYYFFKTPLEGAQSALYAALDPHDTKFNGKYVINCEISRAMPWAYDDITANQVWEKTMNLISVSDDELKSCLA